MEKKSLRQQVFKNCKVIINTIGDARSKVSYNGSFYIDKTTNELECREVIQRRKPHFYNQVVSDLGDGCKVWHLRDGRYRFQIIVEPEDLTKRLLMNIVRTLYEGI